MSSHTYVHITHKYKRFCQFTQYLSTANLDPDSQTSNYRLFHYLGNAQITPLKVINPSLRTTVMYNTSRTWNTWIVLQSVDLCHLLRYCIPCSLSSEFILPLCFIIINILWTFSIFCCHLAALDCPEWCCFCNIGNNIIERHKM